MQTIWLIAAHVLIAAMPIEATAAESLAALKARGAKVFQQNCAACHQPNGRGIPGGAANFVDDKTRLAKSDADLLKVIASGLDTKGMPPFEAILPAPQRRAVLAYIRATFGVNDTDRAK